MLSALCICPFSSLPSRSGSPSLPPSLSPLLFLAPFSPFSPVWRQEIPLESSRRFPVSSLDFGEFHNKLLSSIAMAFKVLVFPLWISALFLISPALFESLCFCCLFPLTEPRCGVIVTSLRSHLAQAAPQVQVSVLFLCLAVASCLSQLRRKRRQHDSSRSRPLCNLVATRQQPLPCHQPLCNLVAARQQPLPCQQLVSARQQPLPCQQLLAATLRRGTL